MKAKIQPKKVIKFLCPTCKELLLKVYPYCMIPSAKLEVACGRCINAGVRVGK